MNEIMVTLPLKEYEELNNKIKELENIVKSGGTVTIITVHKEIFGNRRIEHKEVHYSGPNEALKTVIQESKNASRDFMAIEEEIRNLTYQYNSQVNRSFITKLFNFKG